jgi:hypothetical protein
MLPNTGEAAQDPVGTSGHGAFKIGQIGHIVFDQ